MIYSTTLQIRDTDFSLMVDTGSAHAWVGSSNYSLCTCNAPWPTEYSCNIAKTLSVSASEKWVYPFDARYGNGSEAVT